MNCLYKQVFPLALISLLICCEASAQTKKRLILSGLEPNDPGDEVSLELLEIRVAGKSVSLNQRFEADDNWLKETTLLIRNVGKKSIVALDIGGGLLNGIDEELPIGASFYSGIGWQWGKRFDPKNHTPKGATLSPGETVVLTHVNVDALYRRALDERSAGTFCKLQLRGPLVQFSDGTVDADAPIRFVTSRK
jgi:hypothetical protein